MRWSLAQIAKIVDGVAVGEAEVDSVATDSRRIVPGSLFIALQGDRFDGHDFASEALAGGAAAILVEPGLTVAPRVEVSDTLQALADLAAHRREELTATAVAITGSTGKTSTKDLLTSALGVGTWASPRSYNNEIGVPLTVLGAPDDTAVLVLEVGTRGVGHIRSLNRVTRPDIAVITGIGPSHLETLGDVDTVRKAKWELVEGLEGGVAVLPWEDETLRTWARNGGIESRTFGGPGADVTISDLQLDELARPSFRLTARGEDATVQLGVSGAHQARNAAAAAAVGLVLGRALPDLAVGLGMAKGSEWRMAVSSGRLTIVNDAYNANPTSMEAALRATAAMPGGHVAVLGMMAELGPAAAEAHQVAGRLAHELGFRSVIVVGDDPGIADGAGDIAVTVPDAAAARAAVDRLTRPGDVVLVKASRSVGLEALAEELAG